MRSGERLLPARARRIAQIGFGIEVEGVEIGPGLARRPTVAVEEPPRREGWGANLR